MLADYLYSKNLTPTQLHRTLGVTRAAVWRWLYGRRTPSPAMLRSIVKLTEGAVTALDFHDHRPPRCARWVRQDDGEWRWVLPWSNGYDNALRSSEQEVQPDSLSPPVRRAMSLVYPRARFLKSGVFTLDGRVCSIGRIVAEANRLLLSRGEPPIPYPGVEPLHD